MNENINGLFSVENSVVYDFIMYEHYTFVFIIFNIAPT